MTFPKDKRFHNLTGKRFGQLLCQELVGVSRYPAGGIKRVWRFRCDCGHVIEVVAMNIVSGKNRSCGCDK